MAAKNIRYGQGAVYGSLAYDFDNPELYADQYSAPPRTKERTGIKPNTGSKTRTRIMTRARVMVHTKQGLSPVALLGGMASVLLFVIALMANIQLMTVSSTSVALQSQLNELEESQAKLRIAYESAFNLTEIEEYATKSLGMQKPRADQIYYIDTSSPDKAAIIASSTEVSFVDKVADFISGIGEYFR